MKRLFALLLSGAIVFTSAGIGPVWAAETDSLQAESQTKSPPQEGRTRLFNDGWKFYLGNPQGAQEKGFDDSAWRSLSLPHDWSIELDFNPSSPSTHEGGWLDGGTGWYRKTFVLPAEMQGKRISIDFDGVYMDSYTYVNGTQVGNHPYGYTPFSYDITDLVVADGVTENVIAVKVNHQQPSSRYYSGSGIYRDVSLTVTEDVHIGQYGTYVTTPNLKDEYPTGRATVNAQTDLVNESAAARTFTLTSTIYNAQNEAVATASKEVTVEAGAEVTETQALRVDNPTLWELDNPYLYRLETQLSADNALIDTYDTTFGMKWMDFTANDGFYLNGEYTKLHGMCMHHDQGALGAVSTKAAVYRQMSLLKEMGVNSIRTSHNPASRQLIESCNELGILVIEEAFDTWYGTKKQYDYGRFFNQVSPYDGKTWAEVDIKSMVDRDKNDPCILMWSIGNEIDQTSQAAGITTAQNLNRWVKEIDDTHPTTMGENKFKRDPNQNVVACSEAVDIVGHNYSEQIYDEYHEEYPDWIQYGSETSSAVKSRGVYQSSGLEITSYDTQHVGWGRTAEEAWKYDRDRKYVLGQFIWTGFDYIGEPTPFYNSFPAKSSYFGILDTAGFPKDSFYYYQSQWFTAEEKPVVHLLPHWNWQNGKTVEVWAYTNADTVELYLNDTLVGTKRFEEKTTNYGVTYLETSASETGNANSTHLEWNVPFEAGTLTAKAYRNGELIATDSVTTTGEASKVKLTPEKKIITADGSDLAYIQVDITDADGNTVPTADNLVKFAIEGDGKIVGVDNGDAASIENYKDNKRTAFSGKALVIVQSTKQNGSFTLTASSNGLMSDSTTVFTVAPGSAGEETIIGYNVPVLTVDKGTAPDLPSEVEAIYSTGRTAMVAVSWDSYDSALLEQGGKFQIAGQAAGSTLPVSLSLVVREIIGVKPVHVATGLNQLPLLPGTVQLYDNLGDTTTRAVTWDEIPISQVAQTGTFTVNGTIEGSSLQAAATVRVTDQSLSGQNIAPMAVGLLESSVRGDNLNSINDGNIGGTAANQRWTNWNNGVSTDSGWVGFEWGVNATVKDVSLYFYTDGSVKLPRDVTVSYWNDGAWTPVPNQVNPTWEAGTNAAPTKNTITFDPVSTSKLKIEMFSQTGKFIGITEAEVTGSMLVVNNTAELSSITVGGEELSGFSPETTYYTLYLDYGAPVPAVEATAKDNAAVTIIPALDNKGQTIIEVVSEDGSATREYTLDFMEKGAPIASAELSADSVSLTEDDIVNLHLSALKQDGSPVPADEMQVVYTVEQNPSGTLEVIGNQIYAYQEGTARITAKVTYDGKTVSSNALDIAVSGSAADKHIVSVEKVSVTTDLGKAPTLPAQVKASYNIGLPRMVDVIWDEIPEANYQKLGSFLVFGTVEGTEIKAQAVVTVKGVLAVQNFSLATPLGVAPTLPETVTVYYSDNTQSISPVTWDAYDTKNLTSEQTFVIEGTVEGSDLRSRLSIRVTSDTVNGDNFALARNGWDLPAAIASFSNTNRADSGDRVANLNDDIVERDPNAANNRWCNWVVPIRSSDWAGVIYGHGQPEKKSIDNMEIDFYTDPAGTLRGATLPESYVIEYYTGELTSAEVPANKDKVSTEANSPLNNDANWKAVENLQTPEALSATETNHFTFNAVETYAVRIRMTAKADTCLAITELRTYEKIAEASGCAQLSGIQLDGAALTGFAAGTYEYTLPVTRIPEVSASAPENASVTVLQSIGFDTPAQIIVTSENGQAQNTYTIHFTESPHKVTEIRVTSDADKITQAGGTLQMTASVVPEDAADKSIVWGVIDADGDGKVLATISQEGLLTAGAESETVKVIAAAQDGSGVTGEKTIVIDLPAPPPAPDKTKLRELIASAEQYDPADYLEPGRQNLIDALAAARSELANTQSTEEDVQAAYDRLSGAMNALITLSSQQKLQALVDEASAYLLDQYVDGAVKTAFAEALDGAKAVLLHIESQTQVTEAADTLEAAMKSLIPRADKSELIKAITDAQALDLSPYTEESAQALLDALEVAKALAAEDLSLDRQEEIAAQLALLRKAQESLVKEEKPSSPETPSGSSSTPGESSQQPGPSESSKPDASSTPTTGDSAPFTALAVLAVAGTLTVLAVRKKKE